MKTFKEYVNEKSKGKDELLKVFKALKGQKYPTLVHFTSKGDSISFKSTESVEDCTSEIKKQILKIEGLNSFELVVSTEILSDYLDDDDEESTVYVTRGVISPK